MYADTVTVHELRTGSVHGKIGMHTKLYTSSVSNVQIRPANFSSLGLRPSAALQKHDRTYHTTPDDKDVLRFPRAALNIPDEIIVLWPRAALRSDQSKGIFI